MKVTLDVCQTAEDILRSMQTISGDAIAMYDEKKLEWC
jgi:hypothetical protein